MFIKFRVTKLYPISRHKYRKDLPFIYLQFYSKNKSLRFGSVCVLWLEETFGYGGDLCKKLITMDLNLGGQGEDNITMGSKLF